MSTDSPETLSTTEQHQLLNSFAPMAGTERQFQLGIRNQTMALLMLDAGLRVGEVVQLLQSDLTMSSQPMSNLLIRRDISKTHSERTIPLSSRVRNSIISMQERWWFPHISSNCFHAFYNIKTFKPLTTRQVERIIGTASSRVLGRSVNPHVLRHTFASKLMRITNARVVQDLLGHKQLSSTQIYTHPNGDDRKKAIDALDGKDLGNTSPNS